MEFKETSALKKVWMLDAQHNCPQEVKDEIKEIWCNWGLGNDNYVWKTSIKELAYDIETDCETQSPHLLAYLKAHNIPESETVYLYYWW